MPPVTGRRRGDGGDLVRRSDVGRSVVSSDEAVDVPCKLASAARTFVESVRFVELSAVAREPVVSIARDDRIDVAVVQILSQSRPPRPSPATLRCGLQTHPRSRTKGNGLDATISVI